MKHPTLNAILPVLSNKCSLNINCYWVVAFFLRLYSNGFLISDKVDYRLSSNNVATNNILDFDSYKLVIFAPTRT